MDTNAVNILATLLVVSQAINAFLTIKNFSKEMRKPIEELKARDSQLEKDYSELNCRMKSLKEDVDHAFDKQRTLEQNSLVLERSILALIMHELDGNHTQALTDARKELEDVI